MASAAGGRAPVLALECGPADAACPEKAAGRPRANEEISAAELLLKAVPSRGLRDADAGMLPSGG